MSRIRPKPDLHPDDAVPTERHSSSASTGMNPIFGYQAQIINANAGASFWQERALQLQVILLQRDAEIAALKKAAEDRAHTQTQTQTQTQTTPPETEHAVS